MTTRRDFIRTSLVVASGLAVAGGARAAEGTPGIAFPGVIYTAADPGKWAKKVESHAPQVSVEDGSLTIVTDHSMSPQHFIVRHTLVTGDGEVIGATTFQPDDEPKSTYALPEGFSGKLYATSFCNKHDFWVTELTV